MNVRDKLYKKYKVNNVEINLINYRTQRNKVNDLVRSAKYNYKVKIADKIKNTNISTKHWWKLSKFLLKDTNSAFGTIPPLQSSDGHYVYNNIDKTNLLNEYFTNITKLLETNPVPQPGPSLRDSKLSNILVTDNDVLEILTNLDITKAVGPDEISPRCLRAGKHILAPQLAKLFNLSLSQRKFPMIWKLAHVIPIYKKGEPDKCSNYRPISLLSCVSKIMERAVFKHLYTYLKVLITKEQAGFLPSHSMVTQLQEI
jgi:hypothetical protein